MHLVYARTIAVIVVSSVVLNWLVPDGAGRGWASWAVWLLLVFGEVHRCVERRAQDVRRQTAAWLRSAHDSAADRRRAMFGAIRRRQKNREKQRQQERRRYATCDEAAGDSSDIVSSGALTTTSRGDCACGYPPNRPYALGPPAVAADNDDDDDDDKKTTDEERAWGGGKSRQWEGLSKGQQRDVANKVVDQIKNGVQAAAGLVPVVGPLVALVGDKVTGWIATSVMSSLFGDAPPVPDPVLERLDAIAASVNELHAKVDEVLSRMTRQELLAAYLQPLARMDAVEELVRLVRNGWLDIVRSRPGSDRRRTDAVQRWARDAIDSRIGVVAKLRAVAYESVFYGDVRRRGLFDAWRDLVEYDGAQAWALRFERVLAATGATDAGRRMVWRRTALSHVTPRVFADQGEVDAVWAEHTRWLELQASALQMMLEASNVPQGAVVDNSPEAIVAAARPKVDTVDDADLVAAQVNRQLAQYVPQIGGGQNSFQYAIQVAPNLLWALWPPGEAPDTERDGVDARGWRLPTPAEVTFFVLQLGCDAPYDTTVDTPQRRQAAEVDQPYLMYGDAGAARVIREGIDRAEEPQMAAAYEELTRRLWPADWKAPGRDAYFWPRRDVTDSVWRQAAGFLAPDSTLLSFEVGYGGGIVSGVYRSDLNWITTPGAAFPPATPGLERPERNNQPLYRMLVRQYDTRLEHLQTTPARNPPLNATTATAYRPGDLLVESGDGVPSGGRAARWLLGHDGRRSWLVTDAVAAQFRGGREWPANATQLADVAVGAPLYYESFHDSRRFAADIQPAWRARFREGDVLASNTGIWAIAAGRRHHVASTEAYADLGKPYRRLVVYSDDAYALRAWPAGYEFRYRALPDVARGVVATGDVVKSVEVGTIWYIQGGTKHGFSGAAYAAAGQPPFRTVSQHVLAAIPDGPNI